MSASPGLHAWERRALFDRASRCAPDDDVMPVVRAARPSMPAATQPEGASVAVVRAVVAAYLRSANE